MINPPYVIKKGDIELHFKEYNSYVPFTIGAGYCLEAVYTFDSLEFDVMIKFKGNGKDGQEAENDLMNKIGIFQQ